MLVYIIKVKIWGTSGQEPRHVGDSPENQGTKITCVIAEPRLSLRRQNVHAPNLANRVNRKESLLYAKGYCGSITAKMAPKSINVLKFVGSISLGLLTVRAPLQHPVPEAIA